MELVTIKNGKPCTSSRMIAGKFGKRHDNVLRAIESLDCSPNFTALNFEGVDYIDQKGELRPEYIITRDGFTFLVMGFTGKQAALFKEEYINAFNELERMVRLPSEDELILSAVNTLQNRIENYKSQLDQANEVIKKQAPKVILADKILDAPDLIPTGIIAKELGMSAVKLNKILHEKGVIFKMADTWVLYAKYQDRGYAKTRTYGFVDALGVQRASIQLCWTERGRAFIHFIMGNIQVPKTGIISNIPLHN